MENEAKRNTHGGPGRGGGRKIGDLRPRRKTINPAGPTVARNVTLDPDVYRQVENYATANGLSFSAAINAMLSAI